MKIRNLKRVNIGCKISKNDKNYLFMKKKKLYIFAIIVVVIIFLAFFSNYEKGVEVGTWGINRSINWGWDFGF